MADHGVDALILLMNGHVGYATGASWPLLDAGLSHVERPVAVVLADDEHPHLFLPFRSGAPPRESRSRTTICTAPVYLEFDHGVEQFARVLAEADPAGRGHRRRRADRGDAAVRRTLFPGGPAHDAAHVVGAAQLVKTRDEISCLRRAARSPNRPWSMCRRRWRPACGRSTFRPYWCAARSSWVPPPTCWRPSGR